MADIKIQYLDIQTELQYEMKGMSVNPTNDMQSFVNFEYFMPVRETALSYGTLERDYWILNGTKRPNDATYENHRGAYVSKNVSNTLETFTVNENGNVRTVEMYKFDTPITLTREWDEEKEYTTSGLTFQFDLYEETYCPKVQVRWYKNDEIVKTKVFYPSETSYFCNYVVKGFNRQEITFYGINKKDRLLKVFNIYDGEIVEFSSTSVEKLKSFKMNLATYPLSIKMPSNTVDFEMYSNANKEYIFRVGQPIKVYIDNEYYMEFFIGEATQKSKNSFSVHCVDLLSYLDSATFSVDKNYPYLGSFVDVESFEEMIYLFMPELEKHNINVSYPDFIHIKELFANPVGKDTYKNIVQKLSSSYETSICYEPNNTIAFKHYKDGNYHIIPNSRIYENMKTSKSEMVTGAEISVNKIVFRQAPSFEEIDSSKDIYDFQVHDGSNLAMTESRWNSRIGEEILLIKSSTNNTNSSLYTENFRWIYGKMNYTTNKYENVGMIDLADYVEINRGPTVTITKAVKIPSWANDNRIIADYYDINGGSVDLSIERDVSFEQKNIKHCSKNPFISSEEQGENFINDLLDFYDNYVTKRVSFVWNRELLLDQVQIYTNTDGYVEGIIIEMSLIYLGNSIKCEAKILVPRKEKEQPRELIQTSETDVQVTRGATKEIEVYNVNGDVVLTARSTDGTTISVPSYVTINEHVIRIAPADDEAVTSFILRVQDSETIEEPMPPYIDVSVSVI